MDESIYQMGSQPGKHWAMRDATADQLRRVKALGIDRNWIDFHCQPAQEFTHIVAPEKSDFIGTDSPRAFRRLIILSHAASTVQSVDPWIRGSVDP